MRQFLLKMALWACIILAWMLVIEHFMNRNKGSLKYLAGSDVLTALSKSKSPAGKSVLILGDSVGNQLYPSEQTYPHAVSLTCNRALSVAGHFFLLNNYVSANEHALPDTIAMIMTPTSLQNQLDRFAYHYMLKNFLTKEYKDEFNEELWTQVRNIPIYWSAPLPFIRVSNFSPEYTPPKDDRYVLFSPISQTYLERIIQLTDRIHAHFFLLCPPVDEAQKEEWEQVFERSAAKSEVPAALFNQYSESMRFVRDSIGTDGIHLRADSIPQDYFGLLP